jgi:hypothetical protein
MSTEQGLRAGLMVGIMIRMVLLAGTISAQGMVAGTASAFTTERPSSVLIFPKVVNTNPDTIIQITNTGQMMTHAHCFYTDGRVVGGEPAWQVTDFEITLTRQQPTHWSVAQGRPVNPQDGLGGLDPGLIPPVSPGFTGFLVCVEVAADGTPVSANSLKGEATVGDITFAGGTNGVSKYNAVGIPACGSPQGPCGGDGESNDGDRVLRLDNQEYAACPGGSYLNFIGEGAPDPVIEAATGAGSVVSTNLTLVPCGWDFQNLVPETTRVNFAIRNEFEVNLSVNNVPVDCWFSQTLDGPDFGPPFPMSQSGLGTTFGKAIIRPTLNSGRLPVIGVSNTLHTAGDTSSDTAARNLHFCSETLPPSSCVPITSEIRLPEFH